MSVFSKFTSATGATAMSLVVVACGDNTVAVNLSFQPVLSGQPFGCNKIYRDVGTTKSTVEVKDFKMYVHKLELLDGAGVATPVVLEQDQRWQRNDLALLDFDDATGACAQGTPETNVAIRGTVPFGDYTGIRFTVGVADEDNHLDAATSPVPLNEPGMWWSWKGGFKYVRLDVKTRANPSYYLHLGATACDGTASGGFSCSSGNSPTITLQTFDLNRDRVMFDVGKLWADVDIDHQIDFQSDFVQGCMAFEGDPECPAVFARLGMAPNGTASGQQSVFSKESL
jgi:uncharacterized repeat protein (TIGR04052 family)